MRFDYAGKLDRQANVGKAKPTNSEFFDTWSNEMAYVLGIVLTDGCITKNTLEIIQKDKSLLDKFASLMAYEDPGFTRDSRTGVWYLQVYSQHIVESLGSLVILPRKSLSVEMPPVSQEFMLHFIVACSMVTVM